MSAITHGGHGHAPDAHEPANIAARSKLDLVALNPGPGFASMTRNLLWFVGVVGILLVVVSVFTTGGATEETKRIAQQHALDSYQMGFLYCLGLALGCLGIQMILQQFNAGWSGAVLRTCQTISSLMWVVLLMFIPVAVIELGFTHGLLFSWMHQYWHGKTDAVYQEKSAWLNPTWWLIRSIGYFLIWIAFAQTLYRLSRKQDVTGDRWLTARARFLSSFGLLIFALTTAFAAFDWLMSLDYHWFSTMFGVYFFAGSTVSCFAILCIILCTLRITGRMGPTFTEEHQHDLGKLLFAFTVFWAYITFSQYFLIWYSAVPEEAAFYNLRNDSGYHNLFLMLCFGHFLAPFVILLVRPLKRNPYTLRIIALWMVLMHAVDLAYIARPVISGVAPGQYVWVDIAGIFGPVCLFLGFVIWKMGRAPLVPIKDPRLNELLIHKNYV